MRPSLGASFHNFEMLPCPLACWHELPAVSFWPKCPTRPTSRHQQLAVLWQCSTCSMCNARPAWDSTGRTSVARAGHSATRPTSPQHARQQHKPKQRRQRRNSELSSERRRKTAGCCICWFSTRSGIPLTPSHKWRKCRSRAGGNCSPRWVHALPLSLRVVVCSYQFRDRKSSVCAPAVV